MAVLAVAALSARVMAEAAANDGFDVIALDLFGDEDTRRASSQWLPIGEPAEMRIDPALVLPALQALARRGDVIAYSFGARQAGGRRAYQRKEDEAAVVSRKLRGPDPGNR